MKFSVSPDDLTKLVTDRDNFDKNNRDKEIKEKFESVEGLAKALQSDLKRGLSLEGGGIEYHERQTYYGKNVIPAPPPKSWFRFFFNALQDKTLIILAVASIVSIVLGVTVPPPGESRSTGWIEGTAILIAVLLVSTVTSTNDFQKDRKFRKLSAVSEDRKIKVVRNGEEKLISIFDVVVGDLVKLEMGDYIPADLIYVRGQSVTVDESSMTGEPEAVKKSERDPFLLSNCMVTEGVCYGIAIAVGSFSSWGRIKVGLAADESEQTPLEQKLEGLAEFIGKVGTVAAAFTFVALILKWAITKYAIHHDPWIWRELSVLVDFIITAITIIVVAVPEGLPLAVTLALAYSMMQMIKDQNLVRHLSACETMGGATQICSDKTGTLTQNRMTVTKIWIANTLHQSITGDLKKSIGPELLQLLLEGICLNSSASIQKRKTNNPEFIGQKTECALLVLADKLGTDYEEVRNKIPVAKLYPFSSSKKKMSCIVTTTDGYNYFVKGASEVILDCCDYVLDPNGRPEKLSEEAKEQLNKQIEEWASQGLRTLTLAHNRLPSDIQIPSEDESELNQNLSLIGIVAIEDPIREEVPNSVRTCQAAGITVRMLTGDNILTAVNIAKKCGILTEGALALEGPKFRKMSEPEIDAAIPKLRVIARCSPEDKLILVKRLRALGEVVAVTGDGTNDAPQLKEADVGFAMGISGTEVAKDASDIILMDDNFSSIEKAVLWGRNVYDSIRKFVQFQLTVNLVAVIIAFVGAITEGESPLKAVQLLWVNLIMDTMAALALATEAPTPELMDRPPYGRNAPLITPKMWRLIAGQAFYQLAVLFFCLYGLEHISFFEIRSEEVKTTLIFNTFVFCQLFNEINCRKLGNEWNVFKNIHKNYIFLGVLVFTAVVQTLLVQFGGEWVKTAPLNGHEWLFTFVFAIFTLPLGFLLKLIPVPDDFHLPWRKKTGERTPLLIEEPAPAPEKRGPAENWKTAKKVVTTIGILNFWKKKKKIVKRNSRGSFIYEYE